MGYGRLLAARILLLLLLHSCHSSGQPQGAKFPYVTSNVNEVAGKSFDYIVVGGGAAGCPLAATLSEKFSVLLIERGGSPYGNPWIMNKRFYGFPLLQTDELSSVSQSFTSKEGVVNHRGRVLGGSTALNAGFYSRASNDFVRTAGWDEELVKESYEWVESKIVTKPDQLTTWQAAVKSQFLEAAGILPYNGFTWEHIKGTKLSGSIFDSQGTRHTSADLLQMGRPENIKVLLNATVKSVIFKNSGEANMTIARGVRFISSHGDEDRTYEAYLTSSAGAVILSAGALGSPQILLLSGIGPKPHLYQLNIPVVLESNRVGQEVKDNPGISILVGSKPEYQFSDTPQVAGITKGFKFIIESGIAPISFNETGNRVSIKLAFPESKGKLELNSTDPRKNPEVSYNYLGTEKDMDGCVEMVKLAMTVAKSLSLEMFHGNVPLDTKVVWNPDELRTFCRKNVRTYYHYHGGCLVGSVVDEDYRVVGVKGLRVVDGSTFSESPGTNPMATVLMLGRYQGTKILAERENDGEKHQWRTEL